MAAAIARGPWALARARCSRAKAASSVCVAALREASKHLHKSKGSAPSGGHVAYHYQKWHWCWSHAQHYTIHERRSTDVRGGVAAVYAGEHGGPNASSEGDAKYEGR